MRTLGLLVLLLWQTSPPHDPPVAQPEYLQWQRAVSLPAAATGQVCTVLEGAIFPHAAPSLRDLRVFPVPFQAAASASQHEIPYVITLSHTATDTTDPVPILNLGRTGTKIAFDLEMPPRAYSDVRLALNAQDFLATAQAWGEDTPAAPAARRTALGAFTLFDLTTQRLSRDLTLPLPESTFPYLHVELALAPAPGSPAPAPDYPPAIVTAAEVPPSRTSQTIYTTVAETTALTTSGRETRAFFQLPERLPVERVSFVLAPAFRGNFSRDVTIAATPSVPASHASTPGETLTGTILRLYTTEAGHEIRTEQLGVPAVIGANLQGAATLAVTLENGDDRPLPLTAVKLEMRERRLCLEAGPETASGIALFYGDPALEAPAYDYQRLFRPSPSALTAALGPELANPAYHPRAPQPASFVERHPETLWIALIAVICVLGGVALRSARRLGA